MSVIKNIGAIAQGMTITLKEMFQPTIVENYPDGSGPTKGAMFRSAFAACTSCSATKTDWKNASPVSSAPPPARELHLYRGRRKHRREAHFRRRALRAGL